MGISSSPTTGVDAPMDPANKAIRSEVVPLTILHTPTPQVSPEPRSGQSSQGEGGRQPLATRSGQETVDIQIPVTGLGANSRVGIPGNPSQKHRRIQNRTGIRMLYPSAAGNG